MLKSLNQKLHTPLWLFGVLIVVLILRIPTLFEPYYYGDEMIYIVLGQGLRRGLNFYSQVHDNKPPLLYLIAALAGNLFWFKAILAFSSLIVIYIFWKLTDRLFPRNQPIQKLATFIFALLTTLPFFEGNIVNSELFMLGPTIFAFYLSLSKRLSVKQVFTIGTLFSISALFKIPAAFDMPALIAFWFIQTSWDREGFRNLLKNTLILVLGFTVPILVTFLWYFLHGAFKEYLIAAFLQNFGYLSSWRPDTVKEPFLVKNGPLLVRAGLVGLGTLFLILKRKLFSRQFILIVLWALFSAFAVTLSERPYPHYLVQLVPAISLLVAMLFKLQTMEQVIVIFPLTFLSLIPVYYSFWYYKSLPYYARFANFALQGQSKNEYIQNFGQKTLTHYQIATYIKKSTQKNDFVFVWGDSSAIYALSDRLPPFKYIANYHIRDFSSKEEVFEKLTEHLPQMIVVDPQEGEFNTLDQLLFEEYNFIHTIDSWRIYLRKTRS